MTSEGGEPPCLMNQLDENGQVIERTRVENDELEEKSATNQPDGEPAPKQAQP